MPNLRVCGASLLSWWVSTGRLASCDVLVLLSSRLTEVVGVVAVAVAVVVMLVGWNVSR